MADQMKFHVTREQVEAARNKLAEAGFPISGESGAIENDGYRIGYSFSDGVLILQVLTKPRFVPLIALKAKVRSLLAAEGIEWMQD